MKFEIIKTDKKARAGLITLNENEVETPTFMPVATRGTIKSTPHEYLDKTSILLANAYHLHLRPGAEIINNHGGLHKFMNWDKLILTDSGGFQAWSLPTKLYEDGIEFKNVYDGSYFKLTPQDSIKTQNLLGSDIAMIFDCLIGVDKPDKEQKKAIEITKQWATIAKDTHDNPSQNLFGIVQGGLNLDLRAESAESMINLNFDGYAIGGLAIGESQLERKSVVELLSEILPINKPRYVMGLGDTVGLIDLIDSGVDMFDCVWPARLARHGKLIIKNEYINIKNKKYEKDINPIDEDCNCYTCARFSKAYLRHLYVNENTSSWLYLTVHNIIQTENIIQQARNSILNSSFDSFKKEYLNE
ncbi:MAG: tRNA guanosine(34) transglycosylase Tgt [Candidatus Actinomarina sp.]|tara:strand:- start:229 stop:1305 length:1077 start_codon:yes stop_codon:yes gene_type:complete